MQASRFAHFRGELHPGRAHLTRRADPTSWACNVEGAVANPELVSRPPYDRYLQPLWQDVIMGIAVDTETVSQRASTVDLSMRLRSLHPCSSHEGMHPCNGSLSLESCPERRPVAFCSGVPLNTVCLTMQSSCFPHRSHAERSRAGSGTKIWTPLAKDVDFRPPLSQFRI